MSPVAPLGMKVLIRSRIPETIVASAAAVEEAVNVTAGNIATLAAQASRYDTGNMRAGWQVEDVGTSGKGAAARVFNNVYYTIYHEYGTVYMSAQPMLGPAIEHEQPEFERRIKDAYA